MTRAAAVLIAAIIVGASFAAEEEFDYRSAAFWNGQHTIPGAYGRRFLRVAAPISKAKPVFAAMRRLGGTPAAPSRAVESLAWEWGSWYLPAGRLRGLRETISAAAGGAPVDVTVVSDAYPPSYPELYYKRKYLEEERMSLARESTWKDMPAVSGLVDAQIVHVEHLIVEYEAARSRLEVVVRFAGGRGGRGRRGAVFGLGIASEASRDPEPDWFWMRRTSDAECPRPPRFVEAEAEIRSATDMEELTRRYPLPASTCRRGQGYSLVLAVESAREPDLRRDLNKAGDLLSWRRQEEGGTDSEPVAVTKRRLLAADLKNHPRALEGTPHVAALVAAEMERLKTAADAYDACRGMTIVKLHMSGSGGSPDRPHAPGSEDP